MFKTRFFNVPNFVSKSMESGPAEVGARGAGYPSILYQGPLMYMYLPPLKLSDDFR